MGQNIQEWTEQNLWKTAFKNFTWSILEYFVLDIPDNLGRYQFCPKESNSYCKYWQNGDSGDYKSLVKLPKVIKDLLVSIFSNLRDDNFIQMFRGDDTKS